jgi:hypothetical protein
MGERSEDLKRAAVLVWLLSQRGQLDKDVSGVGYAPFERIPPVGWHTIYRALSETESKVQVSRSVSIQ